MSAQRTPGPWEVGAAGTDIYYPITPDSWVYVASTHSRGACDNDEANAAFIVKAVNAHDELVALLEFWMADGRLQTFADRERFRGKARAVLAKVSQ